MKDNLKISDVGSNASVRSNGSGCPVSFVVPAFQAGRTLERSITSIRAAAPPRSEIVVVDDGSFDATIEIARQLADVVVSQPCQGGAARCRNDGALVAGGDVLFFVDADVTVTPAAVTGMLKHLEQGADAVFGAYEPLPPVEVRNFATTYKNLLHHHTHLRAAGPANTFWSGFGAVRREAFFAVKGFDASVTTGADVEDIHLGYRLSSAGFQILLDPTLQAQHYKRYTVRGVFESDIYHRAIPWTRAILQLKMFEPDLNLRTESMLSALMAATVPASLVGTLWLGGSALLAAEGAATVWLWLNRDLLSYIRQVAGYKIALASAAMLFAYYLYAPVGAIAGTAVHRLRRNSHSVLNSLAVSQFHYERAEIDVTVAVTVDKGVEPLAVAALPPPAPWWELLVVGAERPNGLPDHARYLPSPAGATGGEMRHAALMACKGEMFATLDGGCVPADGWLERVRAESQRTTLAVAGPFEHDCRSVLSRADQVVRYWQWRPERPASWVVNHPSTNTAFRTEVARRLGGFQVEGALILRLAAFGARPVRFDPLMRVRLTGDADVLKLLHGAAGVARLRSSATVRYFDMGAPLRAALIVLSPFEGARDLVNTVREAVREGSAERTFWRALPLIALGRATAWIGRDLGLVRPRLRGGLVPRRSDDLAGLEREVELSPLGSR